MSPFSRRDFMKTSGGLLIGFSLHDGLVHAVHLVAAAPQSPGPASAPNPPLGKIDSWLRIDPDGTVRVFTGKVEIGMGVNLAFSQIVAEELDVAVGRVVMVMGDSAATPDQGGVGGSNSISSGGSALRNVSATARALLLQSASRRLGVPIDALRVRDGVVGVIGDDSRRVTYGELVQSGGLSEDLKVTGSGFSLRVEGSGKPKNPATYTVVGKPLPRPDLSDKVLGTFTYMVDVRVPGMLHGRVVRPSGVGAKFVRMDDLAAKKVAGFVTSVVRGDFVGVVAESEWAAVKAARALNVTWSTPDAAFPDQKDLYAYLRNTPPKASRETVKRGDAVAAMAKAAKKLEAVYEYPFHSHATMGPGCAIADVQPSGVTTVWCGGQKPHALQKGCAEFLGVAPDKVRVVWVEDSGSYGRPGFEDAAVDAMVLSQAVGKPVRVQWMRADMTGWGPKGPAAMFQMSAGLDEQGGVSGFQFVARAFSGGEINFVPTSRGNFLAAHLTGIPNTSGFDEFPQWGNEAPPYAFPDILASTHVVPSFHATPSPLAGTHLRDPNGPSTSFAVESFMDELAAAAGVDPIEFRSRYLGQARANAVMTAAATKYGWQARQTPKPGTRGNVVTGRGAALGIRNGTYVGNIADVEVDRRTGAVRVTRFVVAHDCGLIINPAGLTATIQANIVQAISRTLKEEVRFDRTSVTSVDWTTYPIARASDIPTIDIVLIDHPELPSTGAGEPALRAAAAAIANAIFDATGVRFRQVPFTPERVKAAIA